ncbi:YbaN family protein [Niveispirillum lacus]|nr:YbaN family protein [Niveispirillum lacus]
MKSHRAPPAILTRAVYRLGASVFLLLGMVGMVVPVMPTTVFLLLSVWCLLRLGDHRAERLLNHPRFGAPLRLFMEQGAMTRRAKLAALSSLLLAAVLLVFSAGPHSWLAGAGIGVMVLAGLYLVTRPEPPQTRKVRILGRAEFRRNIDRL